MKEKNIKKIIFNTIVFTGIIHGVLKDSIFFDKLDSPSDFTGNYILKNSDSSGTAVAFNVIPLIIDID